MFKRTQSLSNASISNNYEYHKARFLVTLVYILFSEQNWKIAPKKTDTETYTQTDRQTDNALERVDRANCAMCGPWTLILLVTGQLI